MEPPEIVTVDSAKVACDGGKGALGHPRVFLNMQGKGQIDCPYCGRRRSEEHTSELQSLMRISYAVFCLQKKKEILSKTKITQHQVTQITVKTTTTLNQTVQKKEN